MIFFLWRCVLLASPLGFEPPAWVHDQHWGSWPALGLRASPGVHGEPWGSWRARWLKTTFLVYLYIYIRIYIYILYQQASGTKQYTEAHPPLPSCRGSGGVMCLCACFGSGGVMLCVCACVSFFIAYWGYVRAFDFPRIGLRLGSGFTVACGRLVPRIPHK